MIPSSSWKKAPDLNPADFRLISDAVAGYCGLQVHEAWRARLARLLWPRVEALGMSSFADYRRFLLSGAAGEAEFSRLVDLVVNNETYFFRQEYQLDAFSRELLPILAERNAHRKSLFLWSAGCSTGEEAYTLAILVLESGLFENWRVTVFGTDISQRALAKAKRGVYGPSSLRSDRARDPAILERYFEETPEGWRVVDRVRRLTKFSRGNLLRADTLAGLPQMDAVFCRNVIIYFPEDARVQTIQNLYDKIRPGGYLLLGHSENLLTTSSAFECVPLTGDIVYRRPEEGGHHG